MVFGGGGSCRSNDVEQRAAFGVMRKAMALKILSPAEMRQARLNQPRMKRAEVARQIQATITADPNGGLACSGKAKHLPGGLAHTTK